MRWLALHPSFRALIRNLNIITNLALNSCHPPMLFFTITPFRQGDYFHFNSSLKDFDSAWQEFFPPFFIFLSREVAYNVLVSRRIGDFRQIPDTRHKVKLFFHKLNAWFFFILWQGVGGGGGKGTHCTAPSPLGVGY